MYLVTRRDLPAGTQAAQLAHALAEFAEKYRDEFIEWKENSNVLVLLSVENKSKLGNYLRTAADKHVRAAPFYEEDLGRELTAIAFDGRAVGFLRDLPLALSDVPVAQLAEQRTSNPPVAGSSPVGHSRRT